MLFLALEQFLCSPHRARNVAKAKAGDRRSQLEEVRDAAGAAGPDEAQLQVGTLCTSMPLQAPCWELSQACVWLPQLWTAGLWACGCIKGMNLAISKCGCSLLQALMDSEDWDPNAHDAAMQSAFGEDYYDVSPVVRTFNDVGRLGASGSYQPLRCAGLFKGVRSATRSRKHGSSAHRLLTRGQGRSKTMRTRKWPSLSAATSQVCHIAS